MCGCGKSKAIPKEGMSDLFNATIAGFNAMIDAKEGKFDPNSIYQAESVVRVGRVLEAFELSYRYVDLQGKPAATILAATAIMQLKEVIEQLESAANLTAEEETAISGLVDLRHAI